jgi:hypothetical protein
MDREIKQQTAQIDDQFEDAIHLLRDHGEVGKYKIIFLL